MKTIGILSPEPRSTKFWTKTFGIFDLDESEIKYIQRQALADIALETWIQISMDQDCSLMTHFQSFAGVAQDDRQVAWETDWNRNHKPVYAGYTWDETDDESEEEGLYEKNDEQILGIKTKLKGVVVSHNEIQCPELKEYRVFVGMWEESEVEQPPFGWILSFDAFYSDISEFWVAYFYEPDSDECYDVEKKRNVYHIGISVNLEAYSIGGFFLHEYFGLIADRMNLLSPLPYENLLRKHEPIRVCIIDNRPGNELVRFEISELPTQTVELMEAAENVAGTHELRAYGFLVNRESGLVFVHNYPSSFFYLPYERLSRYGIGSWFEFFAAYDRQ